MTRTRPIAALLLLSACADAEPAANAISPSDDLASNTNNGTGGTLAATGYAPLSYAVDWQQSAAATDGSRIVAVGIGERVLTLHRGPSGDDRLYLGADFRAAAPIDRAPRITPDGLAAVYDDLGRTLYVAVREVATDRLLLGEAAVDANFTVHGLSWTFLGTTEVPPALALGCGRVAVAGRLAQSIVAYTRGLARFGAPFSVRTLADAVTGEPTMAVNVGGEVGLAFQRQGSLVFTSLSCTDRGVPDVWAPRRALPGRVSSTRAPGLAAIGPLFAVAVRGDDGYPYFALQRLGGDDLPVWPAGFEMIDPSPESPRVAVMEPPQLVTFRGVILAAARDGLGCVRYFIRNPGALAARPELTMWIGGRPVGSTPVSVPPAFAMERDAAYRPGGYASQGRVPSDLYLVARGPADQHLRYMNVGRFAALDVLEGIYDMTLDTSFVPKGWASAAGGGLPKNEVPALFEYLLGFLRTPSAYWNGLANVMNPFVIDYGKDSAPCTLDGRYGIAIYPNAQNGAAWYGGNCDANDPGETGMAIPDTSTQWLVFEELGHLAIILNYTWMVDARFRLVFADLTTRSCSADTNCRAGETCVGEMCQVPDGSDGWRPRGFTNAYDATSLDHSFIYAFMQYRWFPQDLDAMIAADNAAGDSRLEGKKIFLRDLVFRGQTFNGSRAAAANNATSDESVGAYGLPRY